MGITKRIVIKRYVAPSGKVCDMNSSQAATILESIQTY